MTAKELRELRNAIRSTKSPNHSLYIEGTNFKCSWNGAAFLWTAPSGTVYTMEKTALIRNIGNGEYVRYFSYDYSCEED